RGVPPRCGAGRSARRCDTVKEGRAGRRLARGHGGDRTLNTRRLMKLRNIVIVTAAAGLALATGGWLLQRETEPTGSVYQQARLFEDVLSHVADFYVDSIRGAQAVPDGDRRYARPAARSVFGIPEAGRLPGVERSDDRQLRRPRHPDRRTGWLD